MFGFENLRFHTIPLALLQVGQLLLGSFRRSRQARTLHCLSLGGRLGSGGFPSARALVLSPVTLRRHKTRDAAWEATRSWPNISSKGLDPNF